jgi:nickel transport protein
MWRNMMFRKIGAVLLLILLCEGPALAHDVWIESAGGGNLAVVYGHPGKTEAYDPAKVEKAWAWGAAGEAVPMSVKKEKDGVVVVPEKGAALVTVQFNNGYWTKTTEGFKNAPKGGIENYMESFHSLRYAKMILGWSDQLKKPQDVEIDLTPLVNPLELKVGDALPLMVYYKGKPVEGAKIYGAEEDGNKVYTDKDGKARVTISKPGRQKIGASYRVYVDNDPDTDSYIRSVNMVFQAGE